MAQLLSPCTLFILLSKCLARSFEYVVPYRQACKPETISCLSEDDHHATLFLQAESVPAGLHYHAGPTHPGSMQEQLRSARGVRLADPDGFLLSNHVISDAAAESCPSCALQQAYTVALALLAFQYCQSTELCFERVSTFRCQIAFTSE
eukprot:1159089-Pelagomonas_calceolata.AAC.2